MPNHGTLNFNKTSLQVSFSFRLSQSCNHVAGFLFRVEAAVKAGLTNPTCTSQKARVDPTVSIWLPTFPVHSFHPFFSCLWIFGGEWSHTPPNSIVSVVQVAKFFPPFCKGNVVISTANNSILLPQAFYWNTKTTHNISMYNLQLSMPT